MATPQLERYADPQAFAGQVRAFLLEHEALHNLPLGILGSLERACGATEAYLALVRQREAVQLVAMRTPPNNLILSRLASPTALPPLVAGLATETPELPGVVGPRDEVRAFSAAWQQQIGVRAELIRKLGIYQLEQLQPVSGVSGRGRSATDADRELIIGWLGAFEEEALGATTNPGISANRFLAGGERGLYLWEDGGAVVSMAGYSSPTPTGIRISAVYTPPALRGRGYAAACVAALSRRLLASGYRRCFLFTDLANPTSNRLYRRLGYQQVGEGWELRFVPAEEPAAD